MKEPKTYMGRWLRDVMNSFCREISRIGHDSGVMLIFCFAGIVYPLLYNWIYSDGVVYDMPVAVVDLSQGSFSRRFIQKLDATSECSISYDCISLEEASELMKRQKVHGVILIPEDFDTNLSTGRQGVVSTYSDMSAFLYYKALTMATNQVMLSEVHDIQAEHYAAGGFSGEDAKQLITPVQGEAFLNYNHNISYTMFFAYMALMLILQQVMFYGSSTVAGTVREEGGCVSGNALPGGMARTVFGRGLAYGLIMLVLGMWGTAIVPKIFNLPVHCRWTDILVLLFFYIADIICFSFTWSSLIYKRETVLVLLLFMTPVAVFLTGTTWPVSSFPWIWKIASFAFPSSFGCRSFMTLCSSGSLDAIAPDILNLTLQTAVYFLLACLAARIESRRKRKETA